MSVILAFIKKELIQTLRDKRMRFIVFVAPIIQLILFGYVVTTDVKNISIYVQNLDQSSVTRELISSFIASGYFKKIAADNTLKIPPETILKNGKAKVVVIIPPDFTQALSKNDEAKIQILVDGSDANAALITKVYIEQILRDFGLKQLATMTQLLNSLTTKSAINLPMITPHISIWYNPELKSSHYMVPGILGLILLIITALLTALAITKEREAGTLEQISVSPLRSWEFILGKTIPYVLIGFIELVLVLIVARLLFQIPVRGSLLLLFLTATIFIFTTLGLGLLAASVSKTQTQAMFTIFPILMPAFLLSGLFFPITGIPFVLRWIAYINPLTYYLIIMRGIVLKGVGISHIYKELILLALFGLALVSFSVTRFRKRIE